jgi:hypothetical protein
VQASGGRVYFSQAGTGEPGVHLRRGERGFDQAMARLHNLEPYGGTLWGLAYALHTDFDLMLTRWGRHANLLLPHEQPGTSGPSEEVLRLTGAWDVRTLVYPRRPSEVIAELRRTRRLTSELRIFNNPRALPRYRFVTVVGRVPDPLAARRLVPRLGYDLRGRDACVATDLPAGRYASATLREVNDDGQVVQVSYRAADRAFLVAAITFAEGWSATLEDGSAVPLCPTLLGQIGAALPAGEHRVRLAYRDRWVPIGAAISLLTVLGAFLAVRRPRRPDAASAPAPAGAPPVESRS